MLYKMVYTGAILNRDVMFPKNVVQKRTRDIEGSFSLFPPRAGFWGIL